jgi:hypothetical protein
MNLRQSSTVPRARVPQNQLPYTIIFNVVTPLEQPVQLSTFRFARLSTTSGFRSSPALTATVVERRAKQGRCGLAMAVVCLSEQRDSCRQSCTRSCDLEKKPPVANRRRQADGLFEVHTAKYNSNLRQQKSGVHYKQRELGQQSG